jgi:hypothetical protein
LKLLKKLISYKIENFIADFGGYLGLLLGASLLDIYDLSLENIKRILGFCHQQN